MAQTRAADQPGQCRSGILYPKVQTIALRFQGYDAAVRVGIFTTVLDEVGNGHTQEIFVRFDHDAVLVLDLFTAGQFQPREPGCCFRSLPRICQINSSMRTLLMRTRRSSAFARQVKQAVQQLIQITGVVQHGTQDVPVLFPAAVPDQGDFKLTGNGCKRVRNSLGGIRYECALGLKGRLEPVQHLVEGNRQLRDLILSIAFRYTDAHAGETDAFGLSDDIRHRLKRTRRIDAGDDRDDHSLANESKMSTQNRLFSLLRPYLSGAEARITYSSSPQHSEARSPHSVRRWNRRCPDFRISFNRLSETGIDSSSTEL